MQRVLPTKAAPTKLHQYRVTKLHSTAKDHSENHKEPPPPIFAGRAQARSSLQVREEIVKENHYFEKNKPNQVKKKHYIKDKTPP